MAYKGNRDPELGILIPINACMLYQSKPPANSSNASSRLNASPTIV